VARRVLTPVGMRITIVLALLCLSVAHARAGAGSFTPKGPHDVGLHLVRQHDFTRAYRGKVDELTGQAVHGQRARPIQTLVWYPATPGGRPMTYRDYLRSRVTEQTFDLPDARVAESVAITAKDLAIRLGQDQARTALSSTMLATVDAPPASGRFPVVIYAAGGGGTADENVDLCEYLASHGYVVIASTSLGTHTKAIAYDLEDVEAQVGDIEFLIGYATTLPQADLAHLAVVGWSWGGMTNVFAAARDSRITALISLDGTREPAFTKLIAPPRITVPWMYVARTPDTIPELNRRGIDTSFSLLNEAKYAELYQLTMYPMAHGDFTSARQRQSSPSDFTEYSKDEVAGAYSWVERYVLEFLDAYLKQDVAGLAFIRNAPAHNAVPAHVMLAERHRADALPLDREAFAAAVARRGFAHAFEAYQAARRRDARFTLSEADLKAWGHGLLDRGHRREAIGIFILWTTLHPDSWDAFDSLAGAYEQTKDTALAITHYRRSLALNPKNDHGRQRLKAL